MFKLITACLLASLAITTGLPSSPILRKLDSERYQHAQDSEGNYHLSDMWMSLNDLTEASRYNPAVSNIYHLFTRANPTVSQPLLYNSPALLEVSNYSSNKRTIVIIHGWRGSVLSDLNTVLVPAFLAAEDVNVIAVDWGVGAGSINYVTALTNTITSGIAVAQFINWLNQVSGTIPVQYHIVGHGLGGHQAGIVGRNVIGDVPYITALDPSMIGWINHSDRFQPTDGLYTEVIHTNAGTNGYLSDLGLVDFYPNGGEGMTGCDSNACDHDRSFHYFAESLTSGGFTGQQCVNYLAALLGQCNVMPLRLQMGGLRPKMAFFGVYHLETNAAPPFSQG